MFHVKHFALNEKGDDVDIKEKIKNEFEKYKISLNTKQIAQFDKYIQLILRENKKYNLTAITNIDEMIVKHLIDSVLPYEYFNNRATVVDIGAGAGFPSVPLMILREDLNFLIIDSVNKKTEFIKMVCSELNLNNTQIIHARCEDLARKPEYRGKYDYCIARGVANLSSLLEYCVGFVKINGEIIAYKGKNYLEELKASHNTMQMLFLELKTNLQYDLINDNETLQRNLLIFEKTTKTPEKYPRLQNKVRLQPLG